MCGIAGLVNHDRTAVDIDVLKAMSQSLQHRGPDDLGYMGLTGDSKVHLSRDPHQVSGSWVCLAHRRLSIIDLSDNAWQPMSSPDRRYHVVYNGEVYNYLELKTELESLGYVFKSTSDTEVVLYAYRAWGKSAVQRFVGMFAFAILDIENKELFLARDPFGIKPLYYVFGDGICAFASEIKALLHIPSLSRRANAQAVFDYLRFGRSDCGDQTFFESIYQVPPAHFLEIPLEGRCQPHPVRYWDLDLTQTTDISFEAASWELRDLLMDSVRMHLRSDVPVGAALSGGIDSSSIAACVHHLEPGTQLHTFTYVPDTPDEGEKRYALEVNRQVGGVSHLVRVSEQDLVHDLEELVYVLDQPFGSTNMYAQYLIYQLSRQNGIKVVLDGQGADELMAGYSHFYVVLLTSLLHHHNPCRLARFLWRASRKQPAFNATTVLFQSLLNTLPLALQNACRDALGHAVCPRWINSRWLSSHAVQLQPEADIRPNTGLRHSLYRSLMTESLPMLLRWQDRNSMAHSVESRVPFLTASLAQFIFRLPDDYLITNDGTRKAVLRSSMQGLVPSSILCRRDKVAFGSPMRGWLSRLIPWVDRVLDSDVVHEIRAFDVGGLQRSWQEVTQGRRPMDDRVWRWISLIKWVMRFDVQWGPRC